ncbi:MAG: hypothetical protein AAGB19_11485 [Cyanobacteria bacterium P01_F01_bin.3]
MNVTDVMGVTDVMDVTDALIESVKRKMPLRFRPFKIGQSLA